MKYILDTNVISELISKKPNKKVINFLQNISDDDLYLSVVTIGEIMLKWGYLTSTLKKKGMPMPIMDAMIAATSISKNFTLITRNEKDFSNLDLEIINPFN